MSGKHPLKMHLCDTVLHANGAKSEFPACMSNDHAARKRGALWPMTHAVAEVTCGNCQHVHNANYMREHPRTRSRYEMTDAATATGMYDHD